MAADRGRNSETWRTARLDGAKPQPSLKIQSIKLVSSSLTSPFSTNMAISETKGQGWRAISTQ